VKIDFDVLTSNTGSIIFSFYIPNVKLLKKITPQIGKETITSKLEFNTKICMKTSKNMFKFQILVLGIGISLYINECKFK